MELGSTNDFWREGKESWEYTLVKTSQNSSREMLLRHAKKKKAADSKSAACENQEEIPQLALAWAGSAGFGSSTGSSAPNGSVILSCL